MLPPLSQLFERKSFPLYYLDQALLVATRSTCLNKNYGAIIVDDNNQIISSGYNGAPRKTTSCKTLGRCIRLENNIESGTHYELCKSVHAEANALIQSDSRREGATMYIAGFDPNSHTIVPSRPCLMCARMIINAGISNVIINSPRYDGESINTFFAHPTRYYARVDPTIIYHNWLHYLTNPNDDTGQEQEYTEIW